MKIDFLILILLAATIFEKHTVAEFEPPRRKLTKSKPSNPGKIVYLNKIGEKPEKSEKSLEKSEKSLEKCPEKSSAEIFFHTVLYK